MPFPWTTRDAIKDHVGVYELELFPLNVDEDVYVNGDNEPIQDGQSGRIAGYQTNGYIVAEGGSEPTGFVFTGVQIGDNLPDAEWLRKDYGNIAGGDGGENRIAAFDGFVYVAGVLDLNVDENGDAQIAWTRDEYGSGGFIGGTINEALPSFSTDTYRFSTLILDDCRGFGILPYPQPVSSPGKGIFCVNPDRTDIQQGGIDSRIVGLVMPDETLVNVLASDDTEYYEFGDIGETILDPTDTDYAWTLTYLGISLDEPAKVICKWAPTQLFSSGTTLAAADCTIFMPSLTSPPDGFDTNWRHMATRDGWLLVAPDDEGSVTKDHVVRVDIEWANWKEIDLVTNDNDVNDRLLNSPVAPHIQVDQFGAWIFYWPAFTVGLTDYEQFWAYAPGNPWDDAEAGEPGEGGDGSTNEPNDPEIDLDGTGAVQVVAWGFSLDGHDFYVIRLGNSTTLVYDLSTGQWSEWASPQSGNWRPFIGTNWLGMGVESMFENPAQAVTKVVAGDDTLGVIWTVDPTIGYDEDPDTQDATPFARVVIGGVPMRMRETQKVGAVYLSLNLGQPQLDGASVTLETSDDFGHNWTDHGTFTVDADNFTQELSWRSLGLIRNPGRIFRITDGGGMVRIDGLDIR